MNQEAAQAALAVFAIFVIVTLIIAIFMAITMWIIFQKAGKPGWAAIVPIYNAIIYAEIAGKPGWWGLLCFIPLLGIIFALILHFNFMDKFGCSTLFTLAAIFFPYICMPILAFGSAQYEDGYEDYDDYDEEYA